MAADYFQIVRNRTIKSKFLNREVKFDLILPKTYNPLDKFCTLYMNDGQDFDQLKPDFIYNQHYQKHKRTFVWVCIHTNERRLQEYGTSYIPDYKSRGALATDYMKFVIMELMPLIQETTPSSKEAKDNYFCGFSLGGLSAFDIVWENPYLFSKVGVFSGSFWWRSKSYEEGYDADNDRIMHTKVKEGDYKKGLKFWLECGTNDEKDDRNNNGIIDSIEDTLELIDELHAKGYTKADTTYLEVKDGEHNFHTWKAVFPQFLDWVFEE